MKTIPSKLWSVASRNQTVSGGGGIQDQNQSIPDFVRGYKYKSYSETCNITHHKIIKSNNMINNCYKNYCILIVTNTSYGQCRYNMSSHKSWRFSLNPPNDWRKSQYKRTLHGGSCHSTGYMCQWYISDTSAGLWTLLCWCSPQ
jgi:hypothetical protein